MEGLVSIQESILDDVRGVFRMGDKSDDRARFLRAFRSVKPVRLREPGEKLPTREELYDRKVLRR